MAAIESLGQEIKRRTEELTAYYNNFYTDDDTKIEAKAKELYPENEELQNSFIAGYKYSLEQPLTRSIHLITMYAYDYVNDKHINMKHVITQIREIFRNKIVKV